MQTQSLVKQILPNALTVLRIALSIALAFLPLLSPPFLSIYLLAGFSDMLDGYLARRWSVSTKLGAYLDSAADFFLCAVLLYRFLPAYAWPIWALFWVGGIALLRLVSLFVCYLKFRRFTFLHTYANKATGFLLLCFPFLLRFFGMQPTVILLCSTAPLSALEELMILIKAKRLNPDQTSLFQQNNPEA